MRYLVPKCLIPTLALMALLVGPLAGGETPTVRLAGIPYRVEVPGRVSLGVYGDNGRLLRSLLVGQPVEPGEHTVVWDEGTGDRKIVADSLWKSRPQFPLT